MDFNHICKFESFIPYLRKGRGVQFLEQHATQEPFFQRYTELTINLKLSCSASPFYFSLQLSRSPIELYKNSIRYLSRPKD